MDGTLRNRAFFKYPQNIFFFYFFEKSCKEDCVATCRLSYVVSSV